jgi:vitamin B12 transporter
MNSRRSVSRNSLVWLSGAVLLAGTEGLRAQDPTAVLPDYVVSSPWVANQQPVGVFAAPVSVLRFEPRVDLQARNTAEAQADVAIRGGIFESSGFQVGGVSLYDPQTGHYFAEIPVAPAMLKAPDVLTGAENAIEGFNSSVGTIAYGWRPVEQRGELTLSAGQYGFNAESIYQGLVLSGKPGGTQVAADAEWARSQSDGAVPYGDHNFQRISGRGQLQGTAGQTDFFAGYQHKFFGWPDLYTPFGVNETEDLQTVLLMANHRWQDKAGDWFEAGAYYRRNRDDYEFDRFVPGEFNPYQHTTWVRGAAVHGFQQLEDFGLNYAIDYLHDDIESTSLVFGPYNDRSMFKIAVEPEKTFKLPEGDLLLRGGLAYDDSDHGKSALSPVALVQWLTPSGKKFYFEYSEATQLPTYTALKSSPTAGLFRGNQNLGRETSRNLEAGASAKAGAWSFNGAVFYRWDDDLVDWTYTESVPAARSANAVDIGVAGIELIAAWRTRACELVLGYTWLHKNADYGTATVDASFYALNFPEHRFTAALTWRLGAGWEIRSDNQYRIQEPNSLRTAGGDYALLSSLGIHYLPPQFRHWEFSVAAENLWNSSFQEVPGVPAAPRQVAASVTARW